MSRVATARQSVHENKRGGACMHRLSCGLGKVSCTCWTAVGWLAHRRVTESNSSLCLCAVLQLSAHGGSCALPVLISAQPLTNLCSVLGVRRGTQWVSSTSRPLWTPPLPPCHQSCWPRQHLHTPACSTPHQPGQTSTLLSASCPGRLPLLTATQQHHSMAALCSSRCATGEPPSSI